jgi:hypothetical protein
VIASAFFFFTLPAQRAKLSRTETTFAMRAMKKSAADANHNARDRMPASA